MNPLHEKSSCCKARVRRFGDRRRQCCKCHRTWSAWPKRRGRKRKRSDKRLVEKYLDHAVLSPHVRARFGKISESTFRRQLERSRDLFLRTTPWPKLPTKNSVILIVDAVIKKIDRKWYTVYCMLVRTTNSNEAVIAPPVILSGTESQPGWRYALNTLPPSIITRSKAVVCDGHKGSVNWAKRQRLVIQRCHFHLIAAIQGRRSRWGKSRHREEGERVYALVIQALAATDEQMLLSTLYAIEDIALSTSSKQLQHILTGFVSSYEDFRTYLYRPELNLPTTSNAVESFISCIEELCHRARGFNNARSLKKWVTAFVKHKKTIVCNRNYQQNKWR